jgi:hypothetical protein
MRRRATLSNRGLPIGVWRRHLRVQDRLASTAGTMLWSGSAANTFAPPLAPGVLAIIAAGAWGFTAWVSTRSSSTASRSGAFSARITVQRIRCDAHGLAPRRVHRLTAAVSDVAQFRGRAPCAMAVGA